MVCRPPSACRLCQALEPYNLSWLGAVPANTPNQHTTLAALCELAC